METLKNKKSGREVKQTQSPPPDPWDNKGQYVHCLQALALSRDAGAGRITTTGRPP
jgi:hypothetical protein